MRRERLAKKMLVVTGVVLALVAVNVAGSGQRHTRTASEDPEPARRAAYQTGKNRPAPAPDVARATWNLRTERPPERPDDPPAPPSALPQRTGSTATVVTFGPYVSRQVNVTAAQANILGDAANEPSMVIDPTDPDRIVIAWRQFDTIASNFRQAGVAYSHDRGLTWTATTLDPGQFRSDPVLDADDAGRIFFSSLSSITTVEIFRSLDAGVTWSAPIPAFGGDKQWIVVDRSGGIGDGHVYQNWNVQFTCCPPNDYTRSIDNGLSYQSPVVGPVPRTKWGTMDVDSGGALLVGGAALDSSLGHLFARSDDAQDPSLTPTFPFVVGVDLGGSTVTGGINPAGLLGQVSIRADKSGGPADGYIYMAGSVHDFSGLRNDGNILNVKFVRSVDGGETFSAPVRVNDTPNINSWNWFGTMSVAPNGRIDMIWNDTRNASDPSGTSALSQVFYSFSLDQGRTWSSNVPVTPQFDPSLGYPQQNKMGDYFHMISDNGGANLAYAATFNGEEDVYFLRIGQDCNGNGIDDDCDVACGPAGSRCDVAGCGTSADCNGNHIPDECEPNEDCQPNGTRDICDIGSGASSDCNANRIPDECEPQDDCNGNGTLDICDLADGTSEDCNENGRPDECDIADQLVDDDNADGVPDQCQAACCTCEGCFDTTPVDCRVRGESPRELGTTCAETPCDPLLDNPCSNATDLPGETSLSVPIDNRAAPTEGPDSVPCDNGTQPFGADLWFYYQAPCDGDLTLSLCGATDYDAIMAVYGGGDECICPQDNCDIIACSDDSCGVVGGPPVITIPVTFGACYTIRVGGWNASRGTGTLNLSLDPDAPGTCTFIPVPVLAEAPDDPGQGLAKNRAVSLKVPSTGVTAGAAQSAIRVRFSRLYRDVDELPDGGCPPRSDTLPDVGAFDGEVRWLGPPDECSEDATGMRNFVAAELHCCPHFRDWSREALVAEFGSDAVADVVHAYGAGVLPCSDYDVQVVDSGCSDLSDERCFSRTLQLTTANWGDTWIPLGGSTQPNVVDVTKVIDKFRGIPFDPGPPPGGAPIKARAMLRGNVPPLCAPGVKINVEDVTLAVDGFRGVEYKFAGPEPCLPCE